MNLIMRIFSILTMSWKKNTEANLKAIREVKIKTKQTETPRW